MTIDNLYELMVPWDKLKSAINNLSVAQPSQVSYRMAELEIAMESMGAEFKRQYTNQFLGKK